MHFQKTNSKKQNHKTKHKNQKPTKQTTDIKKLKLWKSKIAKILKKRWGFDSLFFFSSLPPLPSLACGPDVWSHVRLRHGVRPEQPADDQRGCHRVDVRVIGDDGYLAPKINLLLGGHQ